MTYSKADIKATVEAIKTEMQELEAKRQRFHAGEEVFWQHDEDRFRDLALELLKYV